MHGQIIYDEENASMKVHENKSEKRGNYGLVTEKKRKAGEGEMVSFFRANRGFSVQNSIPLVLCSVLL